MIIELDKQTSDFDSYWVPHSYSLVPHITKKLSKLQFIYLALLARIWGHPVRLELAGKA